MNIVMVETKMPTIIVAKELTFDAAHFLPGLPDAHKCKRLHGHTYRVAVEVAGPMQHGFGWVHDLTDIGGILKAAVLDLDHRCLNDIAGLENPTAENVALFLADRIGRMLAAHLKLVTLTVAETPSSWVKLCW